MFGTSTGNCFAYHSESLLGVQPLGGVAFAAPLKLPRRFKGIDGEGGDRQIGVVAAPLWPVISVGRLPSA